jgi:hypothetical protein
MTSLVGFSEVAFGAPEKASTQRCRDTVSLVDGKIVGNSRFRPVNRPSIDLEVIDIPPHTRSNSLPGRTAR